jgi:FkbM family methyltransferase
MALRALMNAAGLGCNVRRSRMNFLRQMTYSKTLRGLAGRLHLKPILTRMYYRWVASPQGVSEVRTLGLSYKMRLDPEGLRVHEWEVFHSEKDFLEALRAHLHPGETALDVGAALGQFTLPLAKMVGEKGCVVAFEPELGAFQKLVQNVELNRLSNVRPFRKALGERDAVAKIFFGGGQCPSVLAPGEDTTYRSVSEDIEIVRGDSFFTSENLPIPHAVKIDVEGFEYAVLQGLSGTLASPTCRLVCLEVHPHLLPPGVSPEAIMELLRSWGFDRFNTHQLKVKMHMVASRPPHVS